MASYLVSTQEIMLAALQIAVDVIITVLILELIFIVGIIFVLVEIRTLLSRPESPLESLFPLSLALASFMEARDGEGTGYKRGSTLIFLVLA